MLVLAQDHRADPARVVFCHPVVVEHRRSLLVVVGLIVHAMKRQRLNPPALADMKIRVLVPADGIQEKVTDKTGGFGRQLFRLEGQGEFIAAIQKHECVVAFLNQFVHRAVPCAPARWRAPPGRLGPEPGVFRRERQRGGQRGKFAESPPVQITVPGNQSGLVILIRRNLLAEAGIIPVELDRKSVV